MRFGEKLADDNVTVEDTGFIGINTTVELALPKDLLGSLVSNAPGIYASVSINTIDKEYEIHAGLNIKVIECEGILAFKEVTVKEKERILPDKIEFYIRDGLKIPLAPPVLYMTGLGGGINGACRHHRRRIRPASADYTAIICAFGSHRNARRRFQCQNQLGGSVADGRYEAQICEGNARPQGRNFGALD